MTNAEYLTSLSTEDLAALWWATAPHESVADVMTEAKARGLSTDDLEGIAIQQLAQRN